MSKSRIVCGFEIRGRKAKGYILHDHDSFNNWGEIRKPNPADCPNQFEDRFPTRQEAESYAHKCDEFKRGKRSTLA